MANEIIINTLGFQELGINMESVLQRMLSSFQMTGQGSVRSPGLGTTDRGRKFFLLITLQ